jgi:hypothetical protein
MTSVCRVEELGDLRGPQRCQSAGTLVRDATGSLIGDEAVPVRWPDRRNGDPVQGGEGASELFGDRVAVPLVRA